MHGAGFGECDAGCVCSIQEFKEGLFFCVIRLSWVTGGGADAVVFFFDEFVVVKFVGAFVSPGDTGTVVKEFGEGFGEPIGNGLYHDRGVEFMFFAE